MSTITITGLPTAVGVTDTTLVASETSSGVTQHFTALQMKSYMTTLPTLAVAGTVAITGDLSATISTEYQPNITGVGTLANVTTSGQIVSTLATGTAPFDVQSTTLVGNLYVARAVVADSAVGGITTSTTVANVINSDVQITGNAVGMLTTLRTVNSTPGLWGGQTGTTYYIPQIVLNSKGLITSAANIAVNLDLTTQAVTRIVGTANQITANASIGAVQLSLPTQLNITNMAATGVTATGTIAGGTVTDNSNRVITSVTVTASTGLSGGGTITGPTGSVSLTNTGILSMSSGSGISISPGQNPIVTNTGVTGLAGTSGISVSAATGGVTVSPTAGYNGYGVRTVSTGSPSGGSDGDIWYQI